MNSIRPNGNVRSQQNLEMNPDTHIMYMFLSNGRELRTNSQTNFRVEWSYEDLIRRANLEFMLRTVERSTNWIPMVLVIQYSHQMTE